LPWPLPEGPENVNCAGWGGEGAVRAAGLEAPGAFTAICAVKAPGTRGAVAPVSLNAAVDVRRRDDAW
jgi:hypothetical protein